MAAIEFLVDEQNPWPGLSSFTESAQDYFFGRENEIREILSRIEARPFMLLFGQSGLGKTSLLQAGIMPRLRKRNYLPVYLRLDYDLHAPGIDEQIARALLRALTAIGAPVPEHQPGADEEESLWEWLHRADTGLKDATGRPLTPILIIDQFEEIFTLGERDATTRARSLAWFQCLALLVENWCPDEVKTRMETHEALLEELDLAAQPIRILLSMREDFLPHLDEREGQMPSMMLNRLRLTPLRGTEALEAVIRPAPRLVARPVAETIVRFVAGEPKTALRDIIIATPILNLVCRELNERRKARSLPVITPDLIEGDAGKILRQFYEECLRGQPPVLRIFIEEELLSASGHRENISEERADRIMARDGLPKSSLEELVARRLLQKEERLGRYRFELIHDVLCGPIAQSRAERAAREKDEKDEAEKKAVLAKIRQIRRNLTLAGVGLFVMLILVGYAFREKYQADLRSSQVSRIIAIMSNNHQDLVDIGTAYPEFKPMAMDVFSRDLADINQEIKKDGENNDVLWLKLSALYFLADLESAEQDRTGKLDHTQDALKVVNQLIESDKDLDDQSRLGIYLGLLSECFFQMNEDALGQSTYDEGGRILDQVAKRDPAVGHNGKALLISTFYDDRQGVLPPAEKDILLKQCVSESQQAYDAQPGNVRFADNLAGMLKNRASFLVDNQPNGAELGVILKQLHDLEENLRPLIDKQVDQDVLYYRNNASTVLRTKGQIEQEEGKWDDAEDSYLAYVNTRLTELANDPRTIGKFYNDDTQRNLIATAYNDLGDFERARAKAAARDLYKRDAALNEAENAYNEGLKIVNALVKGNSKKSDDWDTLGRTYVGLKELAVQRANIALDAQPSDLASAKKFYQRARDELDDHINALQQASDMAETDEKYDRAQSVAIALREEGDFEVDRADSASEDAPACYARASECYGKSQSLLADLLKERPGDTKLQLSSAYVLDDLDVLAKVQGTAAAEAGRMGEARRDYDTGEKEASAYLQAMQQLCKEEHAINQDDLSTESDLVSAFTKYGDLLRTEAKRLQPAPPQELAQADGQYQLAFQLSVNLTKENPTSSLAWTALAEVYGRMEELAQDQGFAALNRGDVAGAKRFFESANQYVALEIKEARQALKLAGGPEREEKKEKLASALGTASYDFLLTGQYDSALDDANAAIWDDPTDVWITTNQAHALLLQGRFDEAWTVYQQHAFERMYSDDSQTFAQAVLDDFDSFKKAHAFFTPQQLADMDKIRSQLHDLPPPARDPTAPDSN